MVTARLGQTRMMTLSGPRRLAEQELHLRVTGTELDPAECGDCCASLDGRFVVLKH
jgi:hypothetical protein